MNGQFRVTFPKTNISKGTEFLFAIHLVYEPAYLYALYENLAMSWFYKVRSREVKNLLQRNAKPNLA